MQEPGARQLESRALTPESEGLQPHRPWQTSAAPCRRGGSSHSEDGGNRIGGGRPWTTAREGARPRRSLKAGPIAWSHPDGLSLEQVQLGSVVPGTVTNSSRLGVFVDFGAVKDGRLELPKRANFRDFKAGDKIPECMVDWIDVSAYRIGLSIPDHQAFMDSFARAPLTEYHEGQIVDGVVESRYKDLIFVNIGAAASARMKIPRGIHVEHGKPINGLRIEYLDLQHDRISLSWPGVTDHCRSVIDVESGFAGQKPFSSSPSNLSSMRHSSRPSLEPRGVKIPDLRVGDFVDGIVLKVASRGVIVDIGLGAFTSLLEVPAAQRREFMQGDRVEGMIVTDINSHARRVVVVLDNPFLEVMDEVPAQFSSAAACFGGVDQKERDNTPRGKGSQSVGAGRWSGSVQAPAQVPPGDKCSLEELRQGAEVDGVVTRLISRGVLVDIGAETPGLLTTSEDMRSELRTGDMIQGMVIDWIDLQNRQFELLLEHPQL